MAERAPLIEFVYLLTNNQTLTQRIEQQIDAMMLERISDSWLELLHLVCFTGSLGCSVDFNAVKGVLKCDSMNAAVKRFSDEYLELLLMEIDWRLYIQYEQT